MKEKKNRKIPVSESSILETNSAHVGEALNEEDKIHLTVEDRKHLIRVFVVSGILALLVAAVLTVGIIQGRQYQARQEAMSARDDVMFTASDLDAEMKAGELNVALSQTYYSKENGMQLVLVVGNQTTENVEIVGLEVAIYNGTDQLVAKGSYSQKKTWLAVAAGEETTCELYLGPEYVFIRNEPLANTKLRIETTIYHKD